jgi:hypothetical protein
MTTSKKMYIATRYRGGWIPAPSINADFSEVGWGGRMEYINGGVGIQRSKPAHKEYTLVWNPDKRDYLRDVTDIASGLWGPGLIYPLDPMAMDKNLLPQFMASPVMAAYGAPLLVGDLYPILVDTAANSLKYPVQSADYGSGTVRQRVYIPIPPGYTAWVGVHGNTPGLPTLGVLPFTGPTTTSPVVNISTQSVTTITRFSNSFSGDIYRGIEVYALSGAFYAGAMVQVLKTGAIPGTGDFISGQGHSGCEFETTPQQTAYSAPLDRVGVTAKLVEVGAWL